MYVIDLQRRQTLSLGVSRRTLQQKNVSFCCTHSWKRDAGILRQLVFEACAIDTHDGWGDRMSAYKLAHKNR